MPCKIVNQDSRDISASVSWTLESKSGLCSCRKATRVSLCRNGQVSSSLNTSHRRMRSGESAAILIKVDGLKFMVFFESDNLSLSMEVKHRTHSVEKR